MYKRLREIRKELRISQTDFAQSLGINQPMYSLLETGKTPLSDRYVKAMCIFYNVNENWLRTGEGDKFISDKDSGEARIVALYKMLSPVLRKELEGIAANFVSLQKQVSDDVLE